MKSIAKIASLFLALLAHAAQIPAGTELQVRLAARVSSADSKPGAPLKAVLIAPIILDGHVVVPPGAELTGQVKTAQTAAADPQKPPTLDLEFNQLAFDSEHDAISARVSAIDNAKETVDEKGLITGTPSAKTYTSEINRGLEKLAGTSKLSGLAGLLQAAKTVLVKDTDPDITYEEGVEMTLKTAAPFNVLHPSPGIAADVQAIPDDSALANLVSHMPVRAYATDRRPSDLTNILYIGTQEQLAAAFESAGWSTAAQLTGLSKFETARAMIEQRGYKEAPVSVLLIDGHPPDFVYQKQNDTFAARHHLRIWRVPGTFHGQPIWVCTATHDIGIEFSERDYTFIHRIDSNIDAERAKVVNDLIFARKVAALALVPRNTVPAGAFNATGDPLHTDGEVAVLILR